METSEKSRSSHLLEFFPYPLIRMEYTVSDEKILIQKVALYNPGKLYEIYKKQLDITEEEFFTTLKKVQNEPELFFDFIKNRDDFLKKLSLLPEVKNDFFMLQFYTRPNLFHEFRKKRPDFISDYFTIFVNAFLYSPSWRKDTSKIHVFLIFEDLTKENYFFHLISHNVPVGIFIYRDTFIYVNEHMVKITEYPKEELLKTYLWDIADVSIRDEIREVAKLRKEGKVGEKYYYSVPILTRTGKRKWLDVYATTLYWNGAYHGMGMVMDVTDRVLQEKKNLELLKINRLFNKIQEILIVKNYHNAREMLSSISAVIFEELQPELLWLGEFNYMEKEIHILYQKAISRQYENFLQEWKDMSLIKIDIYSRHYQSPFENTILYRNRFDGKEYTSLLEKYGIVSCCVIPVEHPKEKYAIHIYSAVSSFFSEDMLELFQKIQGIVEFSLYKNYQLKWLGIFEEIIKKAPISFLLTNAKNEIIFANPFLESLSGYSIDEILYRDPKIFSSHIHPGEFFRNLWNTVLQKEVFHGLFINRKKNGELFYLQQNIFPIVEENKITNFVGIGLDVTENIKKDSYLQNLILYDPVTGLPNRFYFQQQLLTLLKFHERKGIHLSFALAAFDLENSKLINQLYGGEFGDMFFKKFSEIFRQSLEELKASYLLSRYNDDFSVMLECENEEHCRMVVEELVNILTQKSKEDYEFPGKEKTVTLQFTFHCAITLYPHDIPEYKKNYEEELDTLFRNLEKAMAYAKNLPPFATVFFDTMENRLV